MAVSNRAADRNAAGVTPLPLSRQTAVLTLLIAAVFWGIALVMWRNTALDKWLLISHEGLRASKLAATLAQLASGYGMSVIVLVYLLYWSFAFKYEELRSAYPVYLLLLLLFGIAAIGGEVLKEILNRPRPFVEYAGQIHAFSDAATASLPSGHATKSMALALPFLLSIPGKDQWHKTAKLLLVFIVLGVCYSRVLLGAHYVSDVLAGVGTALAFFPPTTLLTNILLRRMTSERLHSAIRVWGVILVALMIYLALQ